MHAPRPTALFCAVVLVLTSAGCGSDSSSTTTATVEISGSALDRAAAKTRIRVGVPNLIGLRASAAEKELTRLGMRFTYERIDSRCAGEPGRRRITAQQPRARVPGFAAKPVALQTGCPAIESLPACPTAEVRALPSIWEDELGNDRDYRSLSAHLVHRNGDPCRLATAVTVSILDPDGELADVPENPITFPVDLRFGVAAAFSGGIEWESWCGKPKRGFTLAIDWNSERTTKRIDGTPSCQGKSAGEVETSGTLHPYISFNTYYRQTVLGAKVF